MFFTHPVTTFIQTNCPSTKHLLYDFCTRNFWPEMQIDGMMVQQFIDIGNERIKH